MQFFYKYKTCHVTEQNMYVRIAYRKPIFCIYVLHKRHGQFFGSYSQIIFLSNVGGTILWNYFGEKSHIFGSKLDTVSEPYMTVLILLPCSAVLFRRLYLLSFWENISVNISVAMLFVSLSHCLAFCMVVGTHVNAC